jgi:hypothetical protein
MCVFVLITKLTVFKVLPEIAWIAVFHHRQTWYCLFFGCAGLQKIFRVVTKKIGRWGNWKHKYGKIFVFLNKKTAFRFFNILFISYNNFIINYKTVHTLAQLTNTLASTNTKQSTHNSLFTCCLEPAQLTNTSTNTNTKSLHARTPYRWLTVFRK